MMNKKVFVIFFFLQTVTTLPFSALAEARLTFQGTVLDDPPCIFNSGYVINIDFGATIITTRVDGINYSQEVKYNLVCTTPPLNTLRMQIIGVGAAFDAKNLSTDKSNLSISFFADGKALPVNQWLNFTLPQQPQLKAVPVKKTGSTLTGGSFIATATMMIEYQ